MVRGLSDQALDVSERIFGEFFEKMALYGKPPISGIGGLGYCLINQGQTWPTTFPEEGLATYPLSRPLKNPQKS